MVDTKDKKENSPGRAPIPEKGAPTGEEGSEFKKKEVGFSERRTEKNEISEDDRIISAELRKEVDLMELDENAKAEAKKKAEKIEFLGEKEKIEHLLEIAREKGVVFAIQVARKMNEPYLLDILHDTLAQEGFYKKMGRPNDDDGNKKT